MYNAKKNSTAIFNVSNDNILFLIYSYVNQLYDSLVHNKEIKLLKIFLGETISIFHIKNNILRHNLEEDVD